MTLFRMPKWIRRIIRKNTNPVPEIRALQIRRNLSYFYAFIAWNVCGYILYQVYTGRLKKDTSDLSQGRQFARLLKAENVTLLRVEGLTPVGTVDLEEELKKNKKIEDEFPGEEECSNMDQECLIDSEK